MRRNVGFYKDLSGKIGVLAIGIIILLVGIIGTGMPMPFNSAHSTTFNPALNTNFTISESTGNHGEVQLLITPVNLNLTTGTLNAYVFSNAMLITNGSSNNGHIIALIFTVSAGFSLYIYHNATDISGASPVGIYQFTQPVVSTPYTIQSQYLYIIMAVAVLLATLFGAKMEQRRGRKIKKMPNDYSGDSFGGDVPELEKLGNMILDDSLIPDNIPDNEKEIIRKNIAQIIILFGMKISDYYQYNDQVFNDIIEGRKKETVSVNEQ